MVMWLNVIKTNTFTLMVRVKHENICSYFYIFLGFFCFKTKNVDHVFIKAFQVAVVLSLCTDVANVSKDTHLKKEKFSQNQRLRF